MSPNRKSLSGVIGVGVPSPRIAYKSTVSEFGIDDGATRDVVLTAAVLVNPIAHVARRGSDLDRLTARQRPSPQAGPATLVGSRLQPIQMLSVDLHGGKPDGRADQLINRDNGRPGSVRRNRHEGQCALVASVGQIARPARCASRRAKSWCGCGSWCKIGAQRIHPMRPDLRMQGKAALRLSFGLALEDLA